MANLPVAAPRIDDNNRIVLARSSPRFTEPASYLTPLNYGFSITSLVMQPRGIIFGICMEYKTHKYVSKTYHLTAEIQCDDLMCRPVGWKQYLGQHHLKLRPQDARSCTRDEKIDCKLLR